MAKTKKNNEHLEKVAFINYIIIFLSTCCAFNYITIKIIAGIYNSIDTLGLKDTLVQSTASTYAVFNLVITILALILMIITRIVYKKKNETLLRVISIINVIIFGALAFVLFPTIIELLTSK